MSKILLTIFYLLNLEVLDAFRLQKNKKVWRYAV